VYARQRVREAQAARQAEARRLVDEALAEADTLLARARSSAVDDRASWDAAERAAGHLGDHAARGRADPRQLARARTLVAVIPREAAAARRRAEDAVRDRVMLAALEDILLRQSEVKKKGEFDLGRAPREYAAAFRAYGIDPLASPAAEVASRLR